MYTEYCLEIEAMKWENTLLILVSDDKEGFFQNEE
jgi:hypothetical protein